MSIKLKPGKEKNLKWKHPWIFSGAIDKAPNTFVPDTIVESSHGEFLGRGYFNPQSQIAVRILSFENRPFDREFFRSKLNLAFSRRIKFDAQSNSSMRLVASEADQLPGLIVDQYSEVIVTQFLTAGMEHYRSIINDLIVELRSPKSIWDRSDDQVREKEGMKPRSELVYGEQPPELIEIHENGYRLWVDIRNGHKTGFYIDQKNSRNTIRSLSRNQRILNCFSYTGGFTIAALCGGAKEVISIDVSGPALEILQKNLNLNDLQNQVHRSVQADVFDELRALKENGEKFDLIILDPPKFIKSKADLEKATRGYKDINRLAFHLLNPDGILATFSCSGHMDDLLFQKIIFSAAIDAGCDGQVIGKFVQGEDHPILLTFPESSYLKGLLVRKI